VLATVLSVSFNLRQDAPACASRIWPRLRDHIDRELERSRGREWGKGTHRLLASFDGPARAIRCASSIAHYAAKMGVDVRAGLQIGECEVSATGIRGDAVETARVIEQSAAAGEILVSSTVRDVVPGSGIGFQPKGVLGDCGLTLLSVDHGAIY